MNRRKEYIVLILLVLTHTVFSNVFSQTLKAGVDRDKIFIGEQVKLKLAVEGARAGLQWFSFPDSLDHFEVISRGKIDTVLNGSETNYYQIITITSFDSGRWQFPSLFIPNANQPTPPIAIDVLPVDVSGMQDYNDIKDIEEVSAGTDRLIVAVVILITLLSIAAVYWLSKSKRKAPVKISLPKGSEPPLQWALKELARLKKVIPSTPVEVKNYYSELIEISRHYFEMQFQQQLSQQTTDEWMLELQSLLTDKDVKTSFFQVLRLADTVKFAKYLPQGSDHITAVEVVERTLQKASFLQSTIHSKYQYSAS